MPTTAELQPAILYGGTAPAICLAALNAHRTAPETLLLVLSADHAVMKHGCARILRLVRPGGMGRQMSTAL